MIPTSPVRFAHFRLVNRAVITVAYQELAAIRGVVGKFVAYAAAFSSPKDQFAKKKGRLISFGRLKAGQFHTLSNPPMPEGQFGYNNHLLDQIEGHLRDSCELEMKNVPKWLTKYVNLGNPFYRTARELRQDLAGETVYP